MPGSGAYVDASVLGAYYCPEALSSAAENALRALGDPVISSLTEVEFSSLIARKRRLNELDAYQSSEILHLFEDHVAGGFYRRLFPSAEHFIGARKLITAMKSSLRTLDALHLFAAITEGLPLLTADRDFAKAAKGHKVRTILVA